MRQTHRIALGPRFSEGARLLWRALHNRRQSQAAVAARLGVDGGTVNRWLYGDRLPGRVCAELLRRRFGIPVAAWEQAPSVPFQTPARIAWAEAVA